MPVRSSKAPRILDVANQITADIRRQKLKPGDPYRGTAEVAQWLRVSSNVANRAMQLLARRNVLERRQRRGTFIAQRPEPGREVPLRCVHLLVHRDYLQAEGLLADGVVLGIQGRLPDTEIQFNFLPETDETRFVERLVSDALRSPEPEGFVLVRSSVFTQRLLQSSGLPTVIHGTLQHSITGLSFIDRDHTQIGRLAARYLLQRKCRRVAVLLRDRGGRGDHILLDAVGEELTAAGLLAGQIIVRALPADEPAIRAAVHDLIEAGPAPLGLISRSRPLAQGAAAAMGDSSASRRAYLVQCDVYRKEGKAPEFPHILPQATPEEVGGEIARLLERQARGEASQPGQWAVPVRLCIPGEEKAM